MLVEVMRKDVDRPLDEPDDFVGPFPSGAPAIFIDAVARLGTPSGIVGGLGQDEFGSCLKDRLVGDGVDLSSIKIDENLPTGVAFVSYFSDGSRRFLYHMGNSAAGIIGKEDISRAYITSGGLLHINGSSLAMGKAMREACYKAVTIAKEEGLIISFDPNLRTELLGVERTREICSPLLSSCDLLLPGADELKGMTGMSNEEDSAQSLIDAGVKLVAVKDGASGSRFYSEEGVVSTDAYEVKEVDPTGAGDAFSAAVVVGWLEEMEIQTLTRFANAVGAQAVTKKGPMEGLVKRAVITEVISKDGS